MSSTSIQTKNIEHYKEKFQKDILLQGNKVMMYNSFLVGEKPDYNKIRHLLLFDKILCRKNCEIYNYIEDRVMGKDTHCESLYQGIKEYKHCPREKVIEQVCAISIALKEW